MIFLLLFYTFFKIGLFGFGGGYAMLSLIQGEVVTRYGWLTTSQFTDIVAISQMTPGPIGINSATYVGYTALVNAGYSPAVGILGSLMATVAVISTGRSRCAAPPTPAPGWTSPTYAQRAFLKRPSRRPIPLAPYAAALNRSTGFMPIWELSETPTAIYRPLCSRRTQCTSPSRTKTLPSWTRK